MLNEHDLNDDQEISDTLHRFGLENDEKWPNLND